MSDLPTLIVGPTDEPWEWLDDYCDDPLNTVRIDGDLPSVWEYGDGTTSSIFTGGHRPLRVGDRVMLATWQYGVWTSSTPFTGEAVPFATATVAEIVQARTADSFGNRVADGPAWLVTVTDVEAQ